jgi:hypothetical protein
MTSGAATSRTASRRTIPWPSTTISVGRTALSSRARSPHATDTGAGLAVIRAGTAVVVDGAAKTSRAGGSGARADLAVNERWGHGVGEDEE